MAGFTARTLGWKVVGMQACTATLFALLVWCGVAVAATVPTITGFTPQRGVPGTLVKITGTDLDLVTAIEFSGAGPAEYRVPHKTMLKVTVPEGATTGHIVLRSERATVVTAFPFFVPPELPPPFSLSPPRPNPTASGAAIPFALPVTIRTRVRIVDVRGRVVASVLDDVVPAGAHVVTWNGRGAGGRKVAPGVYFVHVNADDRYQAGYPLVVR